MRVIAGTAKGRKLVAPHGMGTRPTPARVREALFSIIAAHIPSAAVLDVFAGTGALGIEALSRGAACATFVERDKNALLALRRNMACFAAQSRVLAMPAQVALTHLAGDSRRFDIIFLDPPYADDLLSPTLASITAGALLAPDGIIVCEHHGHTAPPQAPAGLQRMRSRIFGDVAVSVFGGAEGQSP